MVVGLTQCRPLHLLVKDSVLIKCSFCRCLPHADQATGFLSFADILVLAGYMFAATSTVPVALHYKCTYIHIERHVHRHRHTPT